MGLKEKPKNIIYEFYDIDQAGNDSPLNFVRGSFDEMDPRSHENIRNMGGGGGMGRKGGSRREVASDQGLTARDDMSTILGSVDFKNPVGSTVDTAGTLGLFGNSSGKKRRADASNAAGNAGGYDEMKRRLFADKRKGNAVLDKFRAGGHSPSGQMNCLVPPCPQDGGPDTAANLSQEAALAQAAGSTAAPKEQPEPTSSPEGNEGIKTTGGPTGAINIPTPPKVPSTSTQGGGLSEGEYKLTKIK